MSGGSSDDVILESDDVILESPAWTMTCCDPVLLDLSSVSPEEEELPLQTHPRGTPLINTLMEQCPI